MSCLRWGGSLRPAWSQRCVLCAPTRRPQVWDSHGRQIYACPAGAHVVTSIAWCPNGSCFAVGSFNSLRLCDKTGWSHSRTRFGGGGGKAAAGGGGASGSVMALAWTGDGTEVAGACGSGAVVLGHLVDRVVSWDRWVLAR